MTKMGRPKKEETKNNSVGIRLSNECYARLIQYVTEYGLTIIQVVQIALEKLLKEV